MWKKSLGSKRLRNSGEFAQGKYRNQNIHLFQRFKDGRWIYSNQGAGSTQIWLEEYWAYFSHILCNIMHNTEKYNQIDLKHYYFCSTRIILDTLEYPKLKHHVLCSGSIAGFQCGFLLYHLPLLGNMLAFIYASKQCLHRNSFIFHKF